jgi:O-acetylserine/cysteine efflux transporter
VSGLDGRSPHDVRALLKMKPLHILLMLGTVVVWGFNFVASRVALEVFSAEQMAFLRAALTLAILLPWWRPLAGLPWQLAAAALAIGAGAFYLLYQAIDVTDSLTTVAIGTQLMPPLSAVLAFVFFREYVSSRKWLGILVATLGAIYVASGADSSVSLTALGLTLLSVLLYAAGSILIGKTTSVGLLNMLAWIAAVSLLPLGLLAAASGPLLPEPAIMEARHWLAFLYTVVFSALLGQAVLFHLYRNYPVSEVAPWTLLVPFFAGISAILVYGESIPASLLLGGGVVILGVWIQQGSAAPAARGSPPA